LETSRQVASFSTSSSPLPYDQMKDQCEALVAGKQQKMSVIQSLKHRQENNAIILSSGNEVTVAPLQAKVSIFLQKFNFSVRNVHILKKNSGSICHSIGYFFFLKFGVLTIVVEYIQVGFELIINQLYIFEN